jgi:hypothetical protein
MSQLFITQYLNELDRLRRISGTNRETVVREAFKDLLKSWGKSCELQFIAEYRMVTAAKNQISLDGAVLHSLRVPLGYWEAKDEEDDLDKEIVKKFRKGYPRDRLFAHRCAVLAPCTFPPASFPGAWPFPWHSSSCSRRSRWSSRRQDSRWRPSTQFAFRPLELPPNVTKDLPHKRN